MSGAAANEARLARQKVEKLEEELRDLEQRLALKVPHPGWRAMRGRCVSMQKEQYRYELCFLGSLTQGGTSLGSFERFDGRLTLVHSGMPCFFCRRCSRCAGGAQCWQGPLRSARVEVACGGEASLLSVAEPAKCEYLLKATAPVVCDAARPALLRQLLADPAQIDPEEFR